MLTVFQSDEQRSKIQERHAREDLVKAKKNLEAVNQKRSAKNRLSEVELQQKEAERDNAVELASKEKTSLE